MRSDHATEHGSQQARDSSALESLVHAEKIKDLYSKGVFALSINLINSSILVAALWLEFPHRRTLLWMGLTYALVAFRLIGWIHHQRAKDAAAYDSRRWAREWSIGIFLSGVLWGSAGVLFYTESLGSLYLVLFVIGGMVAGVSASTSSFLPAFTAFTIPALAAPIVRLCVAGDAMHLTMAAFLSAFGLGMTSVAWTGNRAIDESIRLRFKNALLVGDLTAVRDELALLNRELEERIAVRTKELKQAISERDRFVSVVSHELRAPLSSMLLNLNLTSQLIRRPATQAADLHRYCDILLRQANRMLRLVDDLLDLSRLSTGRMQYNKARVDLKSLIERTLEEMAPQLQAAGDARFAVEAEAGLLGNWDPGRLQQVFVNLLTNALRHGAPPFSFTARKVGEDAEVVVKDCGQGIPPQALTRIFEAFASAHPDATPGLGLGLHIAAQIVRAHDGTIRAESIPARGSSFIVRLPLAPA